MDNFDLDNLKKTWQEQSVPPKYEQDDIIKMLNKKSRNYVKYIFWISLAEFLFFAAISVFTVFTTQKSNSFLNILERLGVKMNTEIEMNFEHLYFTLKVISLITTAIFVYLFYKNYRKIKVEGNLKNFILQIVKFKKTVNAFILINIVLLIVFLVIITGFAMGVLHTQNIHLTNPTLIGFLAGIVVGIGFGVLLIWIYYRLVYGIIMRRLGKNLSQLQKIEQEN